MKKRGFTLVEVLVSMFVFTLAFGVAVSTYLVSLNLEQKQTAYLFFESVCLDINQYSDRFGREWNREYFGNDNSTQYYDSSFALIEAEGKYELSFFYNETSELIVNVEEVEKGSYIIENLNYGSSRYV